MDFKKLIDEERAVSPVIGVILMVAITVILAAVIGTFVLGLGDQVQQTTPNVNFAFDYTEGNSDTLEVTHENGDELTGSNVDVVVSGATGTADADGTYTWDESSTLGGDSTVTAGSSVTVNSDNIGSDTANLDLSGATVRVTWTSDSGESSSTLAKWSGPEA